MSEYDLNDFLARPNETSLQHVKNELSAKHAGHPQRRQLALLAIAEIESALSRLHSLGDYYHLAVGAPPVHDEWPRWVFHTSKCPNGRICLCVQDFEELQADDGQWDFTPEGAQRKTGMAAQLLGRGGVKTAQQLAETGLVPTGPDTEAEKAKRIAEFKAERQDADQKDAPSPVPAES